jgi:hypothetical protein
MKKHSRSRAPWLAIFALTLLATPAFAQVPQDMTYTGRLVSSSGTPLAGTVNLELRVFDAETSGTQLYSEEHLGVDLDATGGFSVQLGLGTSPSGGPFDADLFSDVNRWLEVVVDTQVLAPRQIIGSVPWALIAEQANAVVRDPAAPRFEDCGDGTVADHKTGLQWEKKTGTWATPGVDCGTVTCTDPHDVNNRYQWSLGSPYDPDGGAFTDFLTRLNAALDPNLATGCFARRCDWRLPEIAEFQTILVGPGAAPGQPDTCSSPPCIDPEFTAVGGPTASSFYWSASAVADNPLNAWSAYFGDGTVYMYYGKTFDVYVRAVRAGSCH